jgi:hypothetical protein
MLDRCISSWSDAGGDVAVCFDSATALASGRRTRRRTPVATVPTRPTDVAISEPVHQPPATSLDATAGPDAAGQVAGRQRVHPAYREYVRGKYGGAVMESVIRTSAPLARVREEGETVFDHEPGARGARDYASAAEEVIGRIQKDDDADSSPEANSRENPQLSQIVDPG